ncbi:TP53-regulated inhibitor of apoptosis 1-like [Haliotis rubra]|uniref:TP53-regulated inhibitor of apoptosis 1-like n=1 Tax=Haliotis rubra TaxID=36100 RepID=UPI001EE5CD41|nr:TP53-regulated inhibitor of apoptosis 1-like [Haliotis rubra]
MNSVGQECQDLKKAYDDCFNKWFSDKFLKGQKEDECAPLFRVYQNCVKNAIKAKNIDLWQIDTAVLGTEKEKQPPVKKPRG